MLEVFAVTISFDIKTVLAVVGAVTILCLIFGLFYPSN
jgi:hypothetical protein